MAQNIEYSNQNNYEKNFVNLYPKERIGLYDPSQEKDSCGAGFIVNMYGIASHQILEKARNILESMEHRGACGCDSDTGDGAGVMCAIPFKFYSQILKDEFSVNLPPAHGYATGLIFVGTSCAEHCKDIFNKICEERGLKILAWRNVPVESHKIGKLARDSEPLILQVFVSPIDPSTITEDEFKRKVYMVRKYATHRIPSYNLRFYICSLSPYSIVYKGQFRVDQLSEYFTDLKDVRFESHYALVHSRFSTNTFPSWERAQPLRHICHNGEINTLRGNVNNMSAREGIMQSRTFGTDLSSLYPVVENEVSDSGALDNALEFLMHAGGKSLPESIINLIPEARKHNFDEVNEPIETSTLPEYSIKAPMQQQNNSCQTNDISVSQNAPNVLEVVGGSTVFDLEKNYSSVKSSSRRRRPAYPVSAYFKWCGAWMEPWDGPALIVFGGDGRHVGAALDRNGLRPARFYLTAKGFLVLASEVGVFDVDSNAKNDIADNNNDWIIKKGRLKPGKMILVDTIAQRMIPDEEIKLKLATMIPYTSLLHQRTLKLKTLYKIYHARHSTESTNFIQKIGPGGDNIELETNKLELQNMSPTRKHINDLSGNTPIPHNTILRDRRLPIFGFTAETVNLLVLPMIKQRKEALGSMGNDSPLACLSEYNPAIFDYFKQQFAQVTNPAIDPFREKNVMSLAVWIGPAIDPLNSDHYLETTALTTSTTQQCLPKDTFQPRETAPRIYLEQPVLSLKDLEVLKTADYRGLKAKTIYLSFPASNGTAGLERAIDRVSLESAIAVESGYNLLVLSDRLPEFGPALVPIPSLLALGAIHHYLLDKRLRLKTGLIVETGAIRQVAHICLLIGYGADAVCPYLIYELVSGLRDENLLWLPHERNVGSNESNTNQCTEPYNRENFNETFTDEMIYENFRDAAEKGISKVMAKMGISTLHSYKGAQIFEAVGLGRAIIQKCFRGTPSRLGGVTFEMIASELLAQQFKAFSPRDSDNLLLLDPGFYHWREGGERHLNSPEAIANLQKASKLNDLEAYEKFREANNKSNAYVTLRGQMLFDYETFYEELPLNNDPLAQTQVGVGIVPLKGTLSSTQPNIISNGVIKSVNMNGYPDDNLIDTNAIPGSIHLDMVEDAKNIVKRFCTGAMSFGSISLEAHRTLALAMNEIGGKSNTGEGGEDPTRYAPHAPDRSAIKQIASGRFGVTSDYLTNADVLQIKIAQGAKPGEGGELPGYKVTHEIAKTRHSIPGVGLISPPPHHDIYSVEDLAELIYDLKSANPTAKISVKLVSQVGVGVVAAGVAKCKAEHITVSGHDGGTGASSWTGIKHAGLPWELGLAETHQTLILNNLRSRVILQTDGQIRTGRDVVIAALLGADEVAFSTAPLITLGCTMMRKCHLNTCPVGIATQDPDLRAKFAGKPEYVINYLFMIAEEVRQYMARLGFRTYEQMVGRVDKLRPNTHNPINNKARSLDLSAILLPVVETPKILHTLHKGGSVPQDFGLEKKLEQTIMPQIHEYIRDIKTATTTTNDNNKMTILHELNTCDTLNLHVTIANTDRAFGALVSHVVSKNFGENGLPIGYTLQLTCSGHAGQSFGAFLARGIKLELVGDANDYVGKGLSGGEIIVYSPNVVATTAKTEETQNSIENDKCEEDLFESSQNIIIGNACLYGAVKGKAWFGGQAAERFAVRNSGALAVCEGCGDHGCEYMTGGRVIILGMTGRNFAAGMSGGFAYVYDITPNQKFVNSRCNLAMIDIERINDSSTIDHSEDCQFLKQTLQEFVEKTGSHIAARILEQWPTSARNFFKVYPKDYRKALEEIKQKDELESAGKSRQDILKELTLYKQESLLENKLDDPYEDEEGTGVTEDIEDASGFMSPRTSFSENVLAKAEKLDLQLPSAAKLVPNVEKSELTLPKNLSLHEQQKAIEKENEKQKIIAENTQQANLVMEECERELRRLQTSTVGYNKNVKTTENHEKKKANIPNGFVPHIEISKDEEISPLNNSKSDDKLEKQPSLDIIDDKALDKTRGFVKYKRHTNPYRSPQDRIEDWEEIYDWKNVRKTLRVQAARCMDCGVPFCQSNSGCPLGNIIPKWNDLVFKSNWREALETLLQTNNFPEFTGRVCPAPCEGACVLGINEPPVNIKNIECAIIDYAFEKGWIKPNIPSFKTGKTIGIIGSGPAGLAAAAQLNKAGHCVKVYERNDAIGGLLRYGIPPMKLSKRILQRRIDLLQAEGVEFFVNAKIGTGEGNENNGLYGDSKAMLEKHDAILLAAGSTWPRDLPITGRKLKGIHFAMEFLQDWQQALAKHQKTPENTKFALSKAGKLAVKGRNVIVIGGGDTGVDCIATSLRLEAASVVTFEILQEPPKERAATNPWPEWPRVFRVDYGHGESLLKQGTDPRVFCVMSKEFIETPSQPGHVSGISTVLVNWEKELTGRWVMKEKPGSEKTYKADLILLALGFVGPERPLLNFFDLETDLRGNVATPRNKYGTANPKIYAAGDCRRGQSLVVWAINEGRQAARQIDIDLMGRTSLAGPGGIVHTIPKYNNGTNNAALLNF